jgi:hypothetical protein
MAQAAARTLEGPDQGAGLFIFVSYSIIPRRWTSLLLAALELIALLSLSRDATCKTPLDNFYCLSPTPARCLTAAHAIPQPWAGPTTSSP